jgi:hypothetical protein
MVTLFYMKPVYLLLLLLLPVIGFSNQHDIEIQGEGVILTGEYEANIPTPADILGYNIGERFTDYRNLEKYIFAVANVSDRVTILEYGLTYQHRPLRILYISTPENIRNLDRIKQDNLYLTDPRTITDRRAQDIIESTPAILWLAYNVHGNEASGTEAALLTIYHLAASKDTELIAMLESIVIVLDPLVNPDGRERYVNYMNDMSQRNPNPDPQSIEHYEIWPRGRSNHYFFDLNRDWAWLTQKETRQRVALYRNIMPHVYVDYHEMGRESTYFFFPATPPIHPNYPEEVKEWGITFGRGNAAMLDRHGVPYYTGEVFDLFYPGYGDSWPTFNGAIGMTYEQSGGSTGRAYKRKDQHILTLAERAHNHFLTGLSTLHTVHNNRIELLNYFYSFWKDGITGTAGEIKSILIKKGSDPNRTNDLINILLQHGIEVHELTVDKNIRQVKRFFSPQPEIYSFPAGTYIINLNQPKSRLAKTLLEPHTELPDTFFFDITAWSLPTAYNTEAYTAQSYITADVRKITEPLQSIGNVTGRASYAYVISWEQDKAASVLWETLKKDYSINFAMRSFTVQGREFPPGSIIYFTRSNAGSLHDDLQRAALKYGIDIFAIDTGLSEDGIDLGSNWVRPIIKPKIAVTTDRPVIPGDYGELWFLFDEVYEIPFTPLRTEQLSNLDLSQYNLLILPSDGSGQGYRTMFDSSTVESIRQWVQRGGVLITIGGASQFATKEVSGLTSVSSSATGENNENNTSDKERRERLMRMGFFERQEYLQRERIAGALFNVTFDNTHPLGFGYNKNITILKRGSQILQLSDRGYNVGIFADQEPQSGYASKYLVKKVQNTAYLIDFPIGSGRVVMFSDNPHFRMFWHGLTKMFLNATLFLHETI